MPPQRQLLLLLLPAVLLMAACAHTPTPGQTETGRFSSPTHGVAMQYPTTLQVAHGFKSNYFMRARWNPDAQPDARGKGLLTLTLPESNKLITGQLRLGASTRTSKARAECTLPNSGHLGPTTRTTIDGIQFRRRDTSDAGMNHFLLRHAYRGTANGRCYAIDLIVFGTNPGVYPGNPTPPMTKRQAMQRLVPLLDGLSFSNTSK